MVVVAIVIMGLFGDDEVGLFDGFFTAIIMTAKNSKIATVFNMIFCFLLNSLKLCWIKSRVNHGILDVEFRL